MRMFYGVDVWVTAYSYCIIKIVVKRESPFDAQMSVIQSTASQT